jgi:predicted metal-dependent enzyme (double-stranded beta helix superfamily)
MRGGEFFVQEPTVFGFIDEVHSVLERESDIRKRLASLRSPYQKLLENKSWLPEKYRQINPESGMGGGIASWLLYQNLEKDLSLFSLVVPSSITTPIHNHLAWGLVGLYLGEQEEEEFEVEHHDHLQAGDNVRMNRRFLRVLKPGEFYELIPPHNDVHRVKTISLEPSISLHLLANDTGCVVRQKFDLATGHVDGFRSGWSNKPCPESAAEGH